MVMKYFSNRSSRDDYIVNIIQLIPIHDMLTMLNSIKFDDKHGEMILAYIKIINDILLELVLDPSIVQKGNFHFGSMIHRGGKTIFNIFIFMVKNFFQQLCLLKMQFCPTSYSQSDFNGQYILKESPDFLVRRIKILNVIVENCLYGLSLNPGVDEISCNPSTQKQEKKEKLNHSLNSLQNQSIENSLQKKARLEGFRPLMDNSLSMIPGKMKNQDGSFGDANPYQTESPQVSYPGFFLNTKNLSFTEELHKGTSNNYD